MAEAVQRYISYLKAEAKTAKDAEQRLDEHAIPALGSRRVAALTLTDLENWRNGLVRHNEDDPEAERRSKDTANRLLNYLKAALNRLMLDPKNGITDDRAWRFLKPFEAVGQARQAHLDGAQVARLLNVTSGAFQQLVIGALLTGSRAGELKAMHVSDFHKGTSTLHVVGGKQATGCGPDQRGCDVLRRDHHRPPSRRVPFVPDDGAPWGTHDHHRPMAAALTAANLPEDTVFYSLRHTYASQCLMAGMNVQLLAEIMGTSVTMIEKHYGKFTKLARQQQIEAGVPKLNLQPSNVIPLRAAPAR